MKKLILFFVLCFGFVNISFAENGPSDFSESNIACTESECINDRINELININKKLQEDNKNLQEKYNEFNKPLANYIKILAESKDQADQKKIAYIDILTDLKSLIYIFGILLLFIVTGLGLYKNGQISEAKDELKGYKDELKEQFSEYKLEVREFKKTLKEEITPDIKSNLSSELNSIFTENSGKKLDDLITASIIENISSNIYNNNKDNLNLDIKNLFAVDSIEFNRTLEGRLKGIENTLGIE